MHPFTMLEAVVALNAGRLVGVPTDTVYGIAAAPWSEEGMNALFDLGFKQAMGGYRWQKTPPYLVKASHGD